MKHLLRALSTTSMVCVAGAAPANDSEPWLQGQVVVDLDVAGGAGRVFRAGEPVRLSVRVDHDAYVAVYAIDARGDVRWIFPRFWEDDGWVPAGRRVSLDDRGVATQLDRCGDAGITFVQAVASPRCFDWRGLGVRRDAGEECVWWRQGAPVRIQGDPLEGFNEQNRALFPCWDAAVFVTDMVAWHVGRRFDHPTYLCGVCAGRHRGYHDSWVQVRTDFESEHQHGSNYDRRVHQPQYVYCAERRALGHVSPAIQRSVRVEVPRRGATPPAPDSDARNGGRRFRQAEPAVSGGAPSEESAKLALATRAAGPRGRDR